MGLRWRSRTNWERRDFMPSKSVKNLLFGQNCGLIDRSLPFRIGIFCGFDKKIVEICKDYFLFLKKYIIMLEIILRRENAK